MDKNECRERLKKIIAKKMETTMIFPLSEFEREFGYLWGQGRNYDELTPEEKINRDKWDKCRNKILDVGNRQKRNAFTELNQHDVNLKLYHTLFIPVQKGM